MSEKNNEKKDIEVVEGIGNLDISPVYEHLSGSKPKMQDEKPKNIVIPQVKKPKKEDDDVVDSKDDLVAEDESEDDADLIDDIDDIEIEINEENDDSDIDSDLTDDIDE